MQRILVAGLFLLAFLVSYSAGQEVRKIRFGSEGLGQVLRYTDGDSYNGGWVYYAVDFSKETPAAFEQVSDITFKFCSQCGEITIQYFGEKLPTSSDPESMPPSEHDHMHRFKSTGFGTGTALAPLTVELEHIHMYPNAGNYFGITFEESQCTFSLSVFNRTADVPYVGKPMVGLAPTAERSGGDIVVTADPASDDVYPQSSLRYRLYGATFRGDEGWCYMVIASDWQPEPKLTYVSAPMDAMVMLVKVKNPAGGETDYVRVYVPATAVRNGIKIASNILIPLMVLIPMFILFGGYHSAFGARFLVFQYVNPFPDQEEAPIDVMLRKAATHSIILIMAQAICQMLIMTVAWIYEDFLTLHLPLAVLYMPVLLLGVLAVRNRRSADILGYMFMILWLMGMQLALMLIYVNLGSDSIYSGNSSAGRLVTPVIITQVLIAIDTIILIVSLSPTSFLYMKLDSGVDSAMASDPTETGTATESRTAKFTILMSFVYILLTLTWIATNLFYIPQLNLRTEIIFHFFIDSHISIAAALLSLFGTFATLYSNRTFSGLNLVVQLIAFPVIVFSVIVDVAKGDRYQALIHEIAVRVIVTCLRILVIGAQGSLLYFGYKAYNALTDEGPKVIVQRLNPLPALRTIGVTSVVIIVMASILGIIGLTSIVFRIRGTFDFPQIYFMFYILLLGVPSSLLGSYFNSSSMLYLTAALDVVPIMVWFSFVRYGFFYWIVLIFELARLFIVVFSAFVKCIQGPNTDQLSAGDAVGDDEIELEVTDQAGNDDDNDAAAAPDYNDTTDHELEISNLETGVELRDEDH